MPMSSPCKMETLRPSILKTNVLGPVIAAVMYLASNADAAAAVMELLVAHVDVPPAEDGRRELEATSRQMVDSAVDRR